MSEACGDKEVRDRLRLSLLGGFCLTLDGGVVGLSLAGQKLVAFLALHTGPLQRDRVAAALWPTLHPDRSRANLRSILWKLPAEPSLVETVGSQIALAPAVSVDVDDAIGMFQHVLGPGEPACCPPVAGQLWEELLPDWYDEWAAVERERIRQIRLDAQETVCRLMARTGRYCQAVEAGLACTRGDPLRESAHRVLVEAHIAEGNWCEARREYDQYRRLLREELGVSPSPALAALLEAGRTPLLQRTGAANRE